MAGGMRSRPGPTLAERSAAAGIGTAAMQVEPAPAVPAHASAAPAPVASAGPAPAPVASAAPAPAPTPGRSPAGPPVHCWVRLPDTGERVPGLLTAWRREATGWAGQVVYAVREGDDSVLVQAWVPAQHLDRE